MLCDICTHILTDRIQRQLDHGRHADGSDEWVAVRGMQLPTTSQDSCFRTSHCYICSKLHGPVGHFTLDVKIDQARKSKCMSLMFQQPAQVGTILSRFYIQPAELELEQIAAPLDLAARWFSTCLRSHKNCGRGRDPQWSPTRLLDISAPNPRLIDTSKERRSAPYATVSHCWGERRFLMLTAETKAELERGVPLSNFPHTLRCAILSAQALKIKYIWIDCYCIIQDSSDVWHQVDKDFEIARMTDVYSNSILNIGTTGCRDSNEYWLRDHCQTTAPLERINVADATGGKSQLYILYGDGIERAEHMIDQPLFERAWFMQERLLCSRMLHFTRDQIFWECEDCHPFLSETFRNGLASGLLKPMFSVSPRDTLTSTIDTWNVLVEQYSNMNLSFPTKDKLQAIGGLAARVANKHTGRYVAGLFEAKLVISLGWKVKKDATSAQQWRAPSWSWASLDGEISSQRLEWPKRLDSPKRIDWMNRRTELIVVSKINIDLLDPSNPFGRLKSASLTMSVRLLSAAIRKSEQTNRLLIRLAGMEKDLRNAVTTLDGLPETEQRLSSELHIMPLFSQGRIDTILRAILVEELDPGRFVRRGCMNTSGPGATIVMKELDSTPFQQITLV